MLYELYANSQVPAPSSNADLSPWTLVICQSNIHPPASGNTPCPLSDHLVWSRGGGASHGGLKPEAGLSA